MKLQCTGHATIAKSSELSDEDKAKVLAAPEGKVKAVRAKLTDSEGNEVVLQGRLRLSTKGSLTSSFALKLNSFELVDVDVNKAKSEKKTDVNALAEELLGQLNK